MSAAQATESHATKILVVDDEPDVEDLIKRLFRREIRHGRYQFVFAHDGVDALETVLAERDICIVLCDINMPRMDGLTLLGHLDELDRDISVVMVSAYGDMQNIRTAMNRGAYDFVTKPIEKDDLSTTIEKTERHTHVLLTSRDARSRLESVQRELELGERIQRSILPSHFPEDERFQVFASMRAARTVGGDFYDAFQLDDGSVIATIADVCGKGVPAAILMAVMQTIFRTVTYTQPDPAQCLHRINELMCVNLQFNTLLSAVLARYEPASGRLECAIAGHPPPYLLRHDGQATRLTGEAGVILGVDETLEYPVSTHALEPGESVVFYTDGISEARGASPEDFSRSALQSTLTAVAGESPSTICETLMATAAEFAGGAVHDDMTCLALKRVG